MAPKVAVLGCSGFVGKNLLEDLASLFNLIGTSRNNSEKSNLLFFDVEQESSWDKLFQEQPDFVINCIGYGVVKNQQDVSRMLEINYIRTAAFYDMLFQTLPDVFLIHIGTAFEYDLSQKVLTEKSACCPLTFYGISKQLTSNYLLSKYPNSKFCILRPFNMFGPYEHESKIIPYLINAQLQQKEIALSAGTQKRDYFYIKDLSRFISVLIRSKNKEISHLINVGSGHSQSLLDIACKMEVLFSTFDKSYWNWGQIPTRAGESDEFYNGSDLAVNYGYVTTDFELAIKDTIRYYNELINKKEKE